MCAGTDVLAKFQRQDHEVGETESRQIEPVRFRLEFGGGEPSVRAMIRGQEGEMVVRAVTARE